MLINGAVCEQTVYGFVPKSPKWDPNTQILIPYHVHGNILDAIKDDDAISLFGIWSDYGNGRLYQKIVVCDRKDKPIITSDCLYELMQSYFAYECLKLFEQTHGEDFPLTNLESYLFVNLANGIDNLSDYVDQFVQAIFEEDYVSCNMIINHVTPDNTKYMVNWIVFMDAICILFDNNFARNIIHELIPIESIEKFEDIKK